jgi:hypothetical protein
MYRKLLAALVATTLCAPAIAIEPASLAPNSTMFYISIPLDGKNDKERAPSFGMAMRGTRDYVMNIDSRFVNNLVMRLEGEGFGIETAWLVVGGVAAAAAVAVGSSGGSTVQQQQQQQQQAAAQQAAAGTTGTGGTGGTTSGGTAPCTCWR